VGTIEAEQVVTVAVGESHVIETRCSIRIDQSFTTDRLQPGQRIDVWYRGGYISKERFQIVSHEPRCLPFDYGVFSIRTDPEGNWRVSELGTFSMLDSGMRWDEHPLSRILEDSVAEGVGVQR
jgi:hypothetical protein